MCRVNQRFHVFGGVVSPAVACLDDDDKKEKNAVITLNNSRICATAHCTELAAALL